jgi:cytochrome c peroxidase
MRASTVTLLLVVACSGAACAAASDGGESDSSLDPMFAAQPPPRHDDDGDRPNAPPPDIPKDVPPECQNPGTPGGDEHIDFAALRAKLAAQKAAVMARHRALLNARYDLANRPSSTITMFRGKPVQTGIRVKLRNGQTWEDLAAMKPAAIKQHDSFPAGFFPLPHPKHQEGGMLFPHQVIDEVKRQTARDLTRFDLEFDIPDNFLPEFPPPVFLTDRADLGDVSQGKVLTTDNFYETLKGIMNPKQLEGFRLLVTPFPQQQFNVTDDRRSDRPSLGVACFDCHVNGAASGATHLVQDARPQPFRHRVDTPALRGVSIQQLFGSQRALKSVEDFTEFEQRTAYFDGDITAAVKKGAQFLDRALQISGMGEVQNLLDFPPAPKLDLLGRLDPALATAAELRGEALFHGKAKCASCHAPPYYTDNSMHDLHLERFFTPRYIACAMATAEGPIKTFPLRGIKETPPYLHDGRLLTLDDTIEFFNLVLGTKLTADEKADLLAFLYTL